MARPRKITPEVTERITQAIRVGATYELAAHYGGVAYASLRGWIVRGETELERRENDRVRPGTQQWESEQPFVEFVEAMRDAEGTAVVGWLAKIEQAATNGAWQAAAWKLERRYPNEYGRTVVQNEHTGKDGKPIEVQTTIDNPGFDRGLSALADALGAILHEPSAGENGAVDTAE